MSLGAQMEENIIPMSDGVNKPGRPDGRKIIPLLDGGNEPDRPDGRKDNTSV